jgi:beta-lactamase regulating signal transducer with metallopeptidase domain
MNLRPLDSLLEKAFTCAWQASLAASLLVGVILLASLVFRQALPPRWRYALWLLVIVRLLVPAAPSSRWSVFNVGSHLLPAKADPVPAQVSRAWPPRSPAVAPRLGPAASSAPAGIVGPAQLAKRPALPLVIRCAWLAGAAGSFLLVLIQQWRWSNWVRRQPAVRAPRVLALVEAAQALLGLRGEIRVIRTEGQGSPAVFGLRRPCLLLPGEVLESLRETELRLVILHELVHVRRRDVLFNWAAILAQSIHWFNPLAWLAVRRWRAERELVCDAEVMAWLTPPERRAYGATLLKLVGGVAETFSTGSLTPIIEHKHEIERRITMISKYKPAHRLAAVALAVSLLALGALTFTRAAARPEGSLVEKTAPDLPPTARARLIKDLELECARLDDRIKMQQERLDHLKDNLGITDAELSGAESAEPETARKLEASRVEAQARCAQLTAMFTQLENLRRDDLKQAIVMIYPDAQFGHLLENENSAEQKLAGLRFDYAPGHPEMLRASNVLRTVNKQIDERLEGILRGLKAKLDSEKAGVEALHKAAVETRETNLKRASERRPCLQAKRDLENLLALRDRLQARLVEEKLSAGVPLAL